MRNMYPKLSATIVILLLVPQAVSAAWWNPVSWFSAESQPSEQTPVSSSTPERPQATNAPTPDTKTIEGLREEVALLKSRLAALEARAGITQTGMAVQSAPPIAGVSPRIAVLEKRVDALSNPDTSRLTKLEQRVGELSKAPVNPAPAQTKNYDAQISEMAKRINALMHAEALDSGMYGEPLVCTLGQQPRTILKSGEKIYPSCASVYKDLNY